MDLLQPLNVLYDNDAGIRFLLASTCMLDGGMFFEIVQRDRYAGTAPNTGIRLTPSRASPARINIPAPAGG